jgi:hypothetical protein
MMDFKALSLTRSLDPKRTSVREGRSDAAQRQGFEVPRLRAVVGVYVNISVAEVAAPCGCFVVAEAQTHGYLDGILRDCRVRVLLAEYFARADRYPGCAVDVERPAIVLHAGADTAGGGDDAAPIGIAAMQSGAH